MKKVVATWRAAAIHHVDVTGLLGGGFPDRLADFRLPDYLAFVDPPGTSSRNGGRNRW